MPKFICQQCSLEFTAYKGNANKFCSKACYWESKRHKENRKCPICSKEYFAAPSKRADFCSLKCLRKHQSRGAIDVPCKTCGRIIHRWKSSIHLSGNIYCSKKCSSIAVQKPGWKETKNFKVHSSISRMVWRTLKGTKNYRSWQSLVGYKKADLIKHLEQLFQDGMSWGNYGPIWHIDHIVPRSVFNFEKPEDEDFKKCWALKNLQPLWARENIIKSNKLEKHFQPSLIFKNREKGMKSNNKDGGK